MKNTQHTAVAPDLQRHLLVGTELRISPRQRRRSAAVLTSGLLFLFSLGLSACKDASCPPDMAPLPGLQSCVDRFEASWKISAKKQNQAAHGIPLSKPGVQPATLVSWHEAKAACKRSGKHLCRREEWLRACAGLDQTRRYPYGPDYQAERCWDRSRSLKQDHTGPYLTGSAPDCKNPEGVYDLSGNAWEWIDELGPNNEPAVMFGGGSNNDSKGKLSCDPGKRIGQPSHQRAQALGFRCCRDL